MLRRNSLANQFRELFSPEQSTTDFETSAQSIVGDLKKLANDPASSSAVFQALVAQRAREIAAQVKLLESGRVVFQSTETWRTVYEDVLQTAKTRRYLSVALIRTDDYWRDTPGESSLELNYRLVRHGFYVHRLFVIDDFFWPRIAKTPSTQLYHWILEQHHEGIEINLVRLSDLQQDEAIACDMGIYGTDAVGWQNTDFDGRSLRYEISFDPRDVVDAEVRWQQLLLFASPLTDTFAS